MKIVFFSSLYSSFFLAILRVSKAGKELRYLNSSDRRNIWCLFFNRSFLRNFYYANACLSWRKLLSFFSPPVQWILHVLKPQIPHSCKSEIKLHYTFKNPFLIFFVTSITTIFIPLESLVRNQYPLLLGEEHTQIRRCCYLKGLTI